LKEKDTVQEKINTLDLEKEQLLKNLPKNKEMQDPTKIQEKIAEMEKRFQTTSMALADEKKIMAEIKKLKESIPNVQKAIDVKPKLDALYEHRN